MEPKNLIPSNQNHKMNYILPTLTAGYSVIGFRNLAKNLNQASNGTIQSLKGSNLNIKKITMDKPGAILKREHYRIEKEDPFYLDVGDGTMSLLSTTAMLKGSFSVPIGGEEYRVLDSVDYAFNLDHPALNKLNLTTCEKIWIADKKWRKLGQYDINKGDNLMIATVENKDLEYISNWDEDSFIRKLAYKNRPPLLFTMSIVTLILFITML